MTGAEVPTFLGRAAPPVALYVHVPFCVSVCPYCDFVVVAGSATRGSHSRVDRFSRAVAAELELRADLLDERFGRPEASGREPLRSLYFGGGTPSLLDAETLAGLVQLVRRRYGLAPDGEVTLEANPGPNERGDAAAQRDAGINRISIGAQSLDASALARLGRRHTPADVAVTVAAARVAGIASLSIDLLYDTPDQSLASWAQTLESSLDLAPDHLSLYALTLDDPESEGLTGPRGDHLPMSAGARAWRRRARDRQDDDRAVAMYHYAVHRLAEAGYRGYEISNWARPGHESRHNLAYWERRPYEAVGPGAHAFDGQIRRWNAAPFEAYLEALAPFDGGTPQLPPGDEEVVDAASAASEALILGLRVDRGLPMEALTDGHLASVVAWAIDEELLEITDEERVRLTTRGRLLSNEVFARLV